MRTTMTMRLARPLRLVTIILFLLVAGLGTTHAATLDGLLEEPVNISYVLTSFEQEGRGEAVAGAEREEEEVIIHGVNTTNNNNNDVVQLAVNTSTNLAYIGDMSLLVNVTAALAAAAAATSDPSWAIYLSSQLEQPRVHMVYGARQVSFWYHLVVSPTTTTRSSLGWTLQLLVQGNSDNPANQTWSYQGKDSQRILSSTDDDDDDDDSSWQQAWAPLSEFVLLDNNDDGIDTTLNLNRIRGWRLWLQHDENISGGQANNETNATTTATPASWQLYLDYLAFDGPGDMLGAIWYESSMDTLVESNAFVAQYYRSPTSEQGTVESLQGDGSFQVNYTIEQTEIWGGFIGYNHIAPGNSYYNLSGAETIAFDYVILNSAETTSDDNADHETNLRLILQDCGNLQCHDDGIDREIYYSFHYILDDPAESEATIRAELRGNGVDENSPFYRTGWAGIKDNDMLDKDSVKAFVYELSLGPQGDLGSLAVGAFRLSKLRATTAYVDFQEILGQFVEDQSVQIRPHDSFRLNEFRGFQNCLEECQADPNCFYAMSRGLFCFLAEWLPRESIQLEISGETSDEVFVWKNQGRGDFCELCNCQPDQGTIDCRGADLVVIPETFGESWVARTLDLRNNSRLTFIGAFALEALTSIRVLKLPADLVFVSNATLLSLSELREVSFEENADTSNVISGDVQSGQYADVCCGKGDVLDLPEGNDLVFCYMVEETIGVDSFYEPFVAYSIENTILELGPSSEFLSEASESVQKCAAYCEIYPSCNYFRYDARLSLTEHNCRLLSDFVTQDYVCCFEDHYADEDRTMPGVTSGRVQKTRSVVDNARVLIDAATGLVANESNDFTVSFEVRLGSTPIRGAVWLAPTLATRSAIASNIQLEITPTRVVLYDNTTVVPVKVRVTNPSELSKSGSVILTNRVEACDQAFVEVQSTNEDLSVVFDVELETDRNKLLAILLPVLGSLVLVVVGLLLLQGKRRKDDTLWKIDLSDLEFNNPQKVVGRGTFGLVVLAQYRGTQVAVKKVVPPRYAAGVVNDTGSLLPDDTTTESGTETGSAHPGTLTLQPGILRGPDAQRQRIGKSKDSKTAQWKQALRFYKDDLANMRMEADDDEVRRLKSRYWERALQFYAVDIAALKSDFISEMRHLSRLRHPCVTTCMGAVVDRGVDPLLVMEFMEFGSLYDLLHNHTIVIEADSMLQMLRDVARGIRFLHSGRPQVLHGDLKARNILVDTNFRAKVSDFGLSQKKRLGASGTPYWMAPELLRGESSNTAKSDVYSFGILLYEVCSRKEPYEGETFHEVLESIVDPLVNKRPVPPVSCSQEMKDLMFGCLNSSPKMRPNFEELDTRLKDIEADVVVSNRTYISAHQRPRDNRFLRHITVSLNEGKRVEPEEFELVTIAVMGLVDFDDIAARLTAEAVRKILTSVEDIFSKLCRAHSVFAIETVGPLWIGVTNMAEQQEDHAKRMVDFALEAVSAVRAIPMVEGDPSEGTVSVRVGIHSGPCVGNVIGLKDPHYALFGDTVHTAIRLEEKSFTNQIHCSNVSAALLQEQDPKRSLIGHGRVNMKGVGSMLRFSVKMEGQQTHPQWASAGQMLEGEEPPTFRSFFRHHVSENDVGEAGDASEEFAGPLRASLPSRLMPVDERVTES